MKGQNQQLLNINDFIDTHKRDLFAFCMSLTKSNANAEDLFQDTWMKVVVKLNQYNTAYDFKQWLFKISLNTYKDKYRKEKRESKYITYYKNNDEKSRVMENIGDERAVPETCLIEADKKRHLRNCVNKLKDKYRLPIILFYFHEMSQEEIGKVMGIPIGTVKSRLSKSKELLRKEMEVSHNGSIR